MSEPATSTIAISAGAVTLTGSFLGMGYDALLFGFVGVLFSLRMLPAMTRLQLVLAVVTTTMMAALAGPVLASWISGHIPTIASQMGLLRLLAALLIGAAAQLVFPALVGFARKRLGDEP